VAVSLAEPIGAPASGAAPDDLDAVRRRLLPPMPTDRVGGWVASLLVTLVAFGLRLHRLDIPGKQAFDELYYRHDSYNIWKHGVELDADRVEGGFIVHPPVGKWMLGLGQVLFGDGLDPTYVKELSSRKEAFSWRIMAAVFGALTVLMLCRLGRTAVPVHAARLHGGAAHGRRRAALHDEPDRTARHLPALLAGRRGRLPARGPRRPPPAGLATCRGARSGRLERWLDRDPALARRGRHLPGAGGRHEVERRLLPGRRDADLVRLGDRRPARGRRTPTGRSGAAVGRAHPAHPRRGSRSRPTSPATPAGS
jgi:hypothetical protein